MSSIIDKKRERILMISVVGAIAFVGFGVGIRQKPEKAEYSKFSEEAPPEGVLAARTNTELSTNPWRADAPKWSPATATAIDPVTPRNVLAYASALDERATSRAFEGAPPTIPHPVGQGSAKECMVCHQSRGAQIGPSSAPPIPHEAYTVCTQCHVPQSAALPEQDPQSYSELAASDFVGHREAPYPYRAWTGAPPQQPHQTFMREACSSCHGANGQPGLQTSHPERHSCQQCHAPSAQVDQRQ